MKKLLYLLMYVLFVSKAHALEARFHPGKHLYLNEANREHNTYDLIAHLVVIKNDSMEPVKLEKVRYQLFAGEELLQELHVPAESLVKATAELVGMKAEGMQIMVDIMCPPEALGKDGKLASATDLGPGEALTARNVYITVQALPTRLRVEALAKNANGLDVQASTQIDVIQHKSANKYIFPLQGEWFMQAVPNVTSHHRWMSQTEFGIDFLKVDDKGKLFQTDGKQASDFYGYGQPVISAADGVVVTALTRHWPKSCTRAPTQDERQNPFHGFLLVPAVISHHLWIATRPRYSS